MRIITGIISTTHVDKQNDRITRSALDSMATQINGNYIPAHFEHDSTKIIGVVLYGEVFQLNDGEYALGTVSGIYENKEEKLRFKVGQLNMKCEHYKKDLDVDKLKKQSEANQMESKNANNDKKNTNALQEIADLLRRHLDSTQVWMDGTLYNIKGRICECGSLAIWVHPEDHAPAHFHVISKQKGFDARFSLYPIEFVNMKKGLLQKNDIKKVKNFFETNPGILKKLKDEYVRLN